MTTEQETLAGLEASSEEPIQESDWEKTTIQELVDRGIIQKPMDGNHGGDHPTKEDYVEEGIPFIMAKDINDWEIDTSNCKKLPKGFTDNLRKGFAKEGDVLLSHKGTVGRTAVVKNIKYDYLMLSPQTTYYRVSDSDKLNNYYLKYFFDSHMFQETLKNWAGGGSTRPYLGITDQRDLPVILPPKNVQDKIVGHLKPLDQKIRINDRMNETLAEMTRLIFKSWFIDFDHFNQFKETELGRVPKEFDIGTLSEIAGKSHNRVDPSEYPEKAFNLYSFSAFDSRKQPEREVGSEINSQKYEVEDNTILISKLNPRIARIWRVKSSPKNSLSSTEFVNVKPTESYYFEFIYAVGNSEDFQKYLESHTTGTSGSHQRVKQKDILNYPLPIPPKVVIEDFNSVINPIYERIEHNRAENESLKELRDEVLSALMSGEIRVNDIELDELEVDSEV